MHFVPLQEKRSQKMTVTRRGAGRGVKVMLGGGGIICTYSGPPVVYGQMNCQPKIPSLDDVSAIV